MCSRECHVLKYLNKQLRIIYYNDPNPIAIAIYIVDGNNLWYHLKQGDNIINNETKIIWDEYTFNVEYRGSSVYSNYYNHMTFQCDELPIVPSDYGYFDMELEPTPHFGHFVGIKSKNSDQPTRTKIDNESSINIEEINSDTLVNQWINWILLAIIILVIVAIVIWLSRR